MTISIYILLYTNIMLLLDTIIYIFVYIYNIYIYIYIYINQFRQDDQNRCD